VLFLWPTDVNPSFCAHSGFRCAWNLPALRFWAAPLGLRQSLPFGCDAGDAPDFICVGICASSLANKVSHWFLHCSCCQVVGHDSGQHTLDARGNGAHARDIHLFQHMDFFVSCAAATVLEFDPTVDDCEDPLEFLLRSASCSCHAVKQITFHCWTPITMGVQFGTKKQDLSRRRPPTQQS